MKYINNDKYLIPSENPPASMLNGIFSLVRHEDFEKLSEEERRFIIWTMALATEVDRIKIWEEIPGYKYSAYGFANPEFEEEAFGVIIYGYPICRAKDNTKSIRISNHIFPVFIRRINEFYHSDCHPIDGTAGCFAIFSKGTTKERECFVTAKHILPSGIFPGATIQLENGQFGEVADVAYGGLDAAIIEIKDPALYTPGPPFNTQDFVTPYRNYAFRGKISGRKKTKVTMVTDTRGIINSPYLPIRIHLSDHGVPGDSGAVIVDANNDGIGIYSGVLKDQRGLVEGFAQHLGQIQKVMKLKLFQKQ